MIGTRVRDLRKDKGLSLSELAERAGVAKSYLSTFERNIQSNPSIQFLEKIASVLEVPLDSLLQPEASRKDIAMDPEWLDLVQEAMASKVSKEEFRQFLEFNKWKSNRPQD